MKLFVWDDVLVDYTAGIMFAIAEDADAAREEIRKYMRAQRYWPNWDSEDLKNEPSVYPVTEPVARAIYGGG